MRTSTKKSQRRRSPPKRYVARPSKQGWGVDEGDGMFLDDDDRFRGSKPVDFGARGPRGPGGGGDGGGSNAAAAESPGGSVPETRYDCPSCPRAGLTRQGLASHYGRKHGGKVDWGGVAGYPVAARPSSAKGGSNSGRSGGSKKESAGARKDRKQSKPAASSSEDSAELRYDCPSCGKGNLNRQGLAVHFGMKHGGEIDLSKCVSTKYTAASAGKAGKRKRTPGSAPGPAPKRARPGERESAADPAAVRYDCPSCSKTGLTRHGFCVHHGLKHEGAIRWDEVRSYVDSPAKSKKSAGKVSAPAAAKSAKPTKSANKALRYDCPEPKCGKAGMTRQGLRVHYGIKHAGREVDWARTNSYADPRAGAGSEAEPSGGRSGGRQASSSRAAGSEKSHGRKSNRSRRPRQLRPTEKIMAFRQDQEGGKPKAAGTTKGAGRGRQKGAGGSAGGGEAESGKGRARSQSRRHKHCGKCKCPARVYEGTTFN